MTTIVEKVINYCQLHPDHARLVPNELDASLQVSINMKIWPKKMLFRNDCRGQVPWPFFLTNWQLMIVNSQTADLLQRQLKMHSQHEEVVGDFKHV